MRICDHFCHITLANANDKVSTDSRQRESAFTLHMRRPTYVYNGRENRILYETGLFLEIWEGECPK